MDGSVSTLAPLFAAAFATQNTWETFLVGLAASVGAGISMAFAEALSDDGSLTGRGAPVLRGAVTGAMTAAGGLGHTLPYLIPDFTIATFVSFCVVAVELAVISFIRHRFMDPAVPGGRVPDRGRRRAGVRGRHPHRQLIAPSAAHDGAPRVDLMFVLAHLSDPHLAPMPQPSLRDLAGKRLGGFVNWQRNRRHVHVRAALERIVRDLRSRAPDHIAVTGDLVNLSLAAEFAPARAWLGQLGSPQDVTLVPGNHDSYVRATAREAQRQWADYMRADDPRTNDMRPEDVPGEPSRPEATFPFLRRRGPIALIGLSTSAPQPIFRATGRLGAEQLARLGEMLATTDAEGLFRVVLIHHPPVKRPQRRRVSNGCSTVKPSSRCWRGTEPSWSCTATSTFIACVGSPVAAAACRRSACRRPPPRPVGAATPPPTISTRSRAAHGRLALPDALARARGRRRGRGRDQADRADVARRMG